MQSNKIGLSLVIFCVLLLVFIIPKTNQNEEILAYPHYQPSTWHVGDTFSYQGLGRFDDECYEISNITTWCGHEVFNVTQRVESSEYSEYRSHFRTVDTFDLVGRYYDYEGGDIKKRIGSSEYYTDLPVSEYTEGNYTVNTTTVSEWKYQWKESLPNQETLTHSTFYRQVIFSNLTIFNNRITTPVGNFDCWELTDKVINITTNRTTQKVGGEIYLKNEHQKYTYIDSTERQLDIWTTVNGTIEYESFRQSAFNTTQYLSKSLRIIVKRISYLFNMENNTWLFHSGFVLRSLDHLGTKTTPLDQSSTKLDQSTSSMTASSTSATITHLYLIPVLLGVLVLTFKRGKKY